jgi:hypothetical protein
MIQTLHSFDRPMSDEPWTKQGTTWVDGRMETNNYTALIQLCNRVPRYDMLRAGSREFVEATPLGEVEDIPEIAPFQLKKDVKETEKTDYITFAIMATAAVGLYVATM